MKPCYAKHIFVVFHVFFFQFYIFLFEKSWGLDFGRAIFSFFLFRQLYDFYVFGFVYLDFGFSGRISKDKDGNVIESSRKDIEGINGETSWLLISDGKTRTLHGDCRLSKVSPIKYLESFLQQYAPACKDKWAVMDQGGELYQSTAVRSLFKKYGYQVLPTGADSSFQNGPIERAHCTVAILLLSLYS